MLLDSYIFQQKNNFDINLNNEITNNFLLTLINYKDLFYFDSYLENNFGLLPYRGNKINGIIGKHS